MSSTYLAARLQLEDDIRRDRRLTPTARNVGIELIRRRNAKTGQCNISVPRIAETLRCGGRSVDRALAQLESARWIVRTSGKGRSSNHYEIPRLESPQANEPGTGHDASSRQNGATTEPSSRQNGATSEPLSRQNDGVVAPKCASLSRQNGAQSLLEISCSDLTPKAPGEFGGGGSACAPKGGDEEDALWEKFLATYPADQLDPPAPAERLFRALRPEDQRSAVEGLPTYLTLWKSRKRTSRHVGMRKWIEERRWEGLARAAPGYEAVGDEVGVAVYDGTAPAKAWDEHLRKFGKRFVATVTDDHGRRYARKATLWPERQLRTNPYFDGLTGRKPYDLQASEPESPAPTYEIEGLNDPLKDAGQVAAEVLVIARRRGQR